MTAAPSLPSSLSPDARFCRLLEEDLRKLAEVGARTALPTREELRSTARVRAAAEAELEARELILTLSGRVRSYVERVREGRQ